MRWMLQTGALVVAGCAHAATATAQSDAAVLVTVASGLNQPMGIAPEPGTNDRLFVVGKTGLLYVLRVHRQGDAVTYSVAPAPALNITSLVHSVDNQGLLGLAFAPDYAQSGHIYLFHTMSAGGSGSGVIVRYTRDPADPERFLPESRQLIFTAPTGPYHHGGCLRFGPDGYLYFAKGDEGNVGLLQARNPGLIYGKLIRLDVSRDAFPADPNRNYAIPPDNPFASLAGGLPEVYGVGLRSPWQFSFDRLTGDLWLADVGENSWEEVNRIAPGGGLGSGGLIDFGWPSYEGFAVGPFGTLGADPSRINFPAYAYPHAPGPGWPVALTGCSVGGGFVYRGSHMPAWNGRYFWTDFCSARIYSGIAGGDGLLTEVTDMTAGLLAPVPGVTPTPLNYVIAFGEDHAGELFLCEFAGRIRKFVPRYAAADVGQQGGQEGPDGALDNNDFVVFINWFFSSDARCDLGQTGGEPGGDGVIDNNDFIVFLNSFFVGRP